MLSNLEGLIFADDQAGFLTGLIAGGVSSGLSKKVGAIGGLPIPPVKRFANGFKLGVEHACPDCSSTIIYCPFGGAAESLTGVQCVGDFADPLFGVTVAKCTPISSLNPGPYSMRGCSHTLPATTCRSDNYGRR